MNELNILIGNEIKRIRQERNWTQSELCQGICSQAEISKIENGHNSPTVDLLQKIANRLQVPVSLLLKNRKQIKKLKELDHTLLKLTREGNYDRIQRNEGIDLSDLTSEAIILFNYYHMISEYRTGKFDYRTTSVKLYRLLEKKDIKYEFPEIYLRIKMAISILYAENDDYRQAEKIYKELVHSDFSSEEMKVQQLKITYNYAKLLFKVKNFEKGLAVTLEGIRLSVLLNDASYIAHLYYQKGEFFEELYGFDEKTCRAYTMAYELFSAFQMVRYASIVKEVKEKYLCL
ncbi:helix-turn-helix domain-containing protein [Exiguobacterium antarcticum]|uniref:helix-turn-helix domain-containing protein n=1 Tax=Exiguobacterium antarcticum TaxID=132920 RepID=UPI000285E696|nr:helix-turn-helix domain-containing protein [Exiguobacterium antarcticum]AFS70695.1 helix-turn-helix protein [Exiguobacterium antarcticum B7]